MEKNTHSEKKGNGDSRQTWDNAVDAHKARDRSQQAKHHAATDDRKRKGAKPATSREPKAERELLQARTAQINLSEMVGKTQIVQAPTSGASGQPGFYCKVCDVTVKDSLSYLDHINGKNHQRILNRSMKVKIETVEDVRTKLEQLRRKKRILAEQNNAEYDFGERVKVQQLMERERKQRRKQAKDARKNAKAASDTAGGQDPEAAAMAAMMGFSGFGSSKT
ncbi:U4/U6.U5 snRNP associated protein [Linderina macrospora]|uniref:U4/U6.U5 snRNP associated protein n=1 Tax=Linderina macrospora TaxID=4868 RepID=A0ACC1JI63_9FUNG|nr:U4/U6.U5 snRNP associated protein [Linderina macrospora]